MRRGQLALAAALAIATATPEPIQRLWRAGRDKSDEHFDRGSRSEKDERALAKAQAKRERKAAKRLAQMNKE